jgi:pimeloyl-ACP methyl ester carboxylesterase
MPANNGDSRHVRERMKEFDMTSVDLDASAAETAIRDFRVEISQEAVTELLRRLAATRWPDPLATPETWDRGVPVSYLRGLAAYWERDFDWRQQETRLNDFPQFLTDIDEQQIHFIHARSRRSDAVPLLLLHGWPGSVLEFLKVLGPLTDPDGHGAPGAPAFHVVAPSLPGIGFSTPISAKGASSGRIARLFATLMARLGYDRYGVQGGDRGSTAAPLIGLVDSEHVLGIHINAPTVGFYPWPQMIGEQAALQETTGLTEHEKKHVERAQRLGADGIGYIAIQSTRPQTLSYGLTDSPVGQLAWIVEKFREWTDPAKELPEEAVDRDQLLANVSLYWFTGTAGSSADLYWEDTHTLDWLPQPTDIPTGVALFADDKGIRGFAEKTYNIVRWTEFDTGGHFAAMETPDLLVNDIREFFGKLR